MYLRNCVKEGMIPAVFSIEDAKKLSDIAISLDKHVNIDIAVDTGMSRIGYIQVMKL